MLRGADWLAMTGFFDSLRNTAQRAVFLYFSRSAQQNRRGSTRYRHPTNGRAIRGSPAFTSGFDALRAGRGSEFKPARDIPKRKHHPDGWCFFVFRALRSKTGEARLATGIPRMAEPFAGALPLPLDLTRFAPVEAASSSLPATFQKEKPPKGWFFFLERATRLELATSTLARSRSTR